jgi:hypothetical protein
MNKNYKLGYKHAFECTGYAPGEMKRNEFQDYMQNNNEEYNEWN